MGLNITAISIAALISIVVSGCATTRSVSPADTDARNQTWRFDCCNPGLDEGTKWMCDRAIKNPDHVLVDTDGNRYEFVWSECEIGKEPWRKWEE